MKLMKMIETSLMLVEILWENDYLWKHNNILLTEHYGNKTYTQTINLKNGKNKVIIPNVVFDKPGKNKINLTLTANKKTIACQNFEVGVSFEPIVVKLTNPSYRNTFYPGQIAKTISGSAKVNLNAFIKNNTKSITHIISKNIFDVYDICYFIIFFQNSTSP